MLLLAIASLEEFRWSGSCRCDIGGQKKVFIGKLLNPERMNKEKPTIFKKNACGIFCISAYTSTAHLLLVILPSAERA